MFINAYNAIEKVLTASTVSMRPIPNYMLDAHLMIEQQELKGKLARYQYEDMFFIITENYETPEIHQYHSPDRQLVRVMYVPEALFKPGCPLSKSLRIVNRMAIEMIRVSSYCTGPLNEPLITLHKLAPLVLLNKMSAWFETDPIIALSEVLELYKDDAIVAGSLEFKKCMLEFCRMHTLEELFINLGLISIYRECNLLHSK